MHKIARPMQGAYASTMSLYYLAYGQPQLYTIHLAVATFKPFYSDLQPYEEGQISPKNPEEGQISPKNQLHLDMGNLASQGLANCGRVAKSIGEASSTLLAIHGGTTGTVADWYTTRAWSQVVASTCILHLKSKLPQIIKRLLSIQFAVIVLQDTSVA